MAHPSISAHRSLLYLLSYLPYLAHLILLNSLP